jgi:hypothetical protein
MTFAKIMRRGAASGSRRGGARMLLCLCMAGVGAAAGIGGALGAGAALAQSADAGAKYDKQAMIRLGLAHATAEDLYRALKRDAEGGTALTPERMPDWTGLWTRVGPPFYDPDQAAGELTTAKLKPAALEELRTRRELSQKGIEYDPISDCSPPGFPRFLAIPFLREFIVTPGETWMTSETVNNIRRIYTDGRGHTPSEDAYPLWYGDSIGFWDDAGRLIVHTSQLRANIFHRNDPKFSAELETVEIWQKLDDETVVASVWAYDPETLLEPWFVRDTYKQVPNEDKSLRIGYWDCHENPNNVVIETQQGSSQFGDFTFDESK